MPATVNVYEFCPLLMVGLVIAVSEDPLYTALEPDVTTLTILSFVLNNIFR